MPTYYTHVQSPVGPIFLAGREERVVRMSFTSGHQIRHPEPDWIENEKALHPAVEQVHEYLSGERFTFTLVPVLEGTVFQVLVWQALMNIPFGETRSYGEIADGLGRPGAARAVGAANSANYLPLLVPCHRVIGSHGSLTGFGGGLEAKRWLLNFERQFAEAPSRGQLSLLTSAGS